MKKSPRQLEREIEQALAEKSPRQLEHEIKQTVAGTMAGQALFIGVYPTGIVYADRTRERHGDYLRLAFLPYRTLELEWEPKVRMSPELRDLIVDDAERLRARRGEDYPVSSSGQAVKLGHARMIHQPPTGRTVFAAHERDHHITTSGRRALKRS